MKKNQRAFILYLEVQHLPLYYHFKHLKLVASFVFMKAYRTDLCFSPYLITQSCLTTLPNLSTLSAPLYCPMLELEEQRNIIKLFFDPGVKEDEYGMEWIVQL